jgi:hypothetical protein
MLAQAVSDQNGQFNFPESLPRATTLSLVAARFAYSPLRYDALVITREAPDPVKLNLRLTPAP